jgi:hypothetical protein
MRGENRPPDAASAPPDRGPAKEVLTPPFPRRGVRGGPEDCHPEAPRRGDNPCLLAASPAAEGLLGQCCLLAEDGDAGSSTAAL